METVVIKRLKTGFVVESDTQRVKEGTYVPNIKGVVAELYRAFEGTVRVSKDQLAALQAMVEVKQPKK